MIECCAFEYALANPGSIKPCDPAGICCAGVLTDPSLQPHPSEKSERIHMIESLMPFSGYLSVRAAAP
jgi:hypothetical protein